MTVTISNGKKQTELKIPVSVSVGDLKKEFSKASSKSIHRISLKFGDIKLDDDSKTLAQYGASDGAVIQFKDLGPQIGYRTVFLGM